MAHDGPPPETTAIIYDFDGTLAAGNLPEHTFLPSLGVTDTNAFWSDVKARAKKHDAEEVLTYMHRLLELAKERNVPVTRKSLVEHGRRTPFFRGLDTWFNRINAFGADKNLDIKHYVISSGLLEMIEGSEHYSRFEKVYACSYAYDDSGHAMWPASAINYTTKTQFLFRINKGIDNIWDNTSINRWSPHDKRPVSFKRMIFIGDGDTDIPSMKMVRYQGGYAVAVYDPDKWQEKKSQGKLEDLIAEDRVHYVAPADYSDGSQLDVTIRGVLARIALRKQAPITKMAGVEP